MIVKICGITRLEDAQAAVAAGASAIGFIFWPNSPRFIDPYRAKQIARLVLPFSTLVGVFVNQSSEYINAVSSLVGLGVVQLHGDESPDILGLIRRPVVKALSGHAIDNADLWPAHVTLLIDANDPARRGGTGVTADWAKATPVAARRRVMLAGGLNAGNVGEAIHTVRPFGIDVSSGVESAPGIKDPERMTALFEAVRAS